MTPKLSLINLKKYTSIFVYIWYKMMGVRYMHTIQACMLRCFSQVQLFVTLWTAAHQAPLSMGFSRQEYWSGLPCPRPGDFSHPEIEPASPANLALAGWFFTTSTNWEYTYTLWYQESILKLGVKQIGNTQTWHMLMFSIMCILYNFNIEGNFYLSEKF